MKHTKFDHRNRMLGRAWLSYAGKGGGLVPKTDSRWRRLVNVNGFGVNLKNSQHWFEFRRCSL